ncbi:8345_t:CDS:10 [Dentiscutata erythropus]|uniref:8345_t:CDS:1 n=1 Tax=Dentiscutata erythropus TaxID=1348616 RepID=A0A9N8WBB6_9GLOM|nr:8345_t:CDS:10 [Dentiscutata erythropus]
MTKAVKLPWNLLAELVYSENFMRSTLVKNFTIVFLKMAYDRLTEKDKITHLVPLFKNIELKSHNLKKILFQIFLEFFQKLSLKFTDLETKEVVDSLYSLYECSEKELLCQLQSIKFEIMSYLCKSKLAANIFPFMLHVSFNCLYSPKTDVNLQKKCADFIQWITRKADTSIVELIGKVLLFSLLKIIKETRIENFNNLMREQGINQKLLFKPFYGSPDLSIENSEKDQIFKVQVLGIGDERVLIKEIKRQLQSVVDQVNNTTELQPPIGLLTGEHRDTWATARKKLESLSAENKTSFEAIDTALFSVALDDYPTNTNIDISHHNYFHAYNGRNRWFDKSIQLVFANNGRAGINGEVYGMVMGHLLDYIISNEPAQDPPDASSIELSPPQYLKWDVDTSIMNTIKQAQINIQAAINNVDSVLLYYNEYGADWLKNAKVSPDAFVQMAIQLAYYKHYGEPCSAFEIVSTRSFLHGRYKIMPTCSVVTVAFTKAFCDPNVKKDEKVSLLMKAIKAHTESTISAMNGRGMYFHLIGLRSTILDEEKSKATLFTDSSYAQSMHFKLRTSNMSPGLCFHIGFGTYLLDAYGICYIIEKDKLKVSISSNKKYKEADSVMFKKALKESLDDLREILS